MNSYDKHRKELLRISNLTDEEELNGALSGRRKYNPETLRALPFEGISVIHNIEQAEAEKLHLPLMASKFKEELKNENLNDKVVFVSLDSLHVTTFDLINKRRHSNKLAEKGYSYIEVRVAVERAAIKFVKEIAPKLSAKATIKGTGMFAPHVVKLNLKLNDVVQKLFQTYRIELNKYLIDNVEGYSVIRDKNWNRKLSGHITLGYVVNPMNEEEINKFLNILMKFNEEFTPIPFDLTQGEVTEFTDMDHYSVIHK